MIPNNMRHPYVYATTPRASTPSARAAATVHTSRGGPPRAGMRSASAWLWPAACCVAHLLSRARPAAAGCSAAGVTGSDNAGDCAALLAAYAAWNNRPVFWAAGIASGASYCAPPPCRRACGGAGGGRPCRRHAMPPFRPPPLRAGAWSAFAGPVCDGNGRVQTLILEYSLMYYYADNGSPVQNVSLTAPLPAALGLLSALQALTLTGCGLVGTIPEALGSLTSLQSLSMTSPNPVNYLSGTIPAALGSLLSLTVLCADSQISVSVRCNTMPPSQAPPPASG